MTAPAHAFVPVRSQYLSRPVIYCSVCGHRDFWHDEGRCIGCAEPSGNYRVVASPEPEERHGKRLIHAAAAVGLVAAVVIGLYFTFSLILNALASHWP